MAYADYLHCSKCDCKLIYDGEWNGRDWLERKHGEDYEIYCPDCLKELKNEKNKPAPGA